MSRLETDLKMSFEYDPKTGDLWRIRRRCWSGFRKTKEKAGTMSHGYLITGFQDRRLPNHRIAWCLMTGNLPPAKMDVDHINRIKDDNRWKNLRLAKRGQNNMNSGNPSNNTTGQKGVHLNRDNGYQARIKVDGKVIHLGCFEKFEDAMKARKQTEQKYFGAFARTK